MKTLPMTKTFGATLLLATLLSAGAMPANAQTTCTWQSGIVSDAAPCPQPVFTITQTPPFTVGSPIVMHGSGFAPGETVTVADIYGSVTLSAVASADGEFNLDWAVPNYTRMAGVMLSAIGDVSNFQTQAYQVRQEAATITYGSDMQLHGWYPGEELAITVDDMPQPSAYASADGTSPSFQELRGKLEVWGKQSGGSYLRMAGKIDNGSPRPPVTVEPAPEEIELVVEPVADALDAPVEEPLAAPVVEPAVEPVVVEPQAQPVKAPAPSRPQPQAAVAAVEANPAGQQVDPAGLAVGALLAGAVTVLTVRRGAGRKVL